MPKPKKPRSRQPRKNLKQLINQEINRVSETKVLFSLLDEHSQPSNADATVGPFSLIAHGNQGNQRIGQQVKPISLKMQMIFRPKSLETFGDAQYDSSFYSRVILVRQKPAVRLVSSTPAPILLTNSNYFKKGGNTTGPIANDFRDLFYTFNNQLGTVIFDKKFFISGQTNQNNTREINFTYRFPKTAMMNFTDNSSYPHEMVSMYIINRKADDDTDASPKNIEYCGHVELYYKDM